MFRLAARLALLCPAMLAPGAYQSLRKKSFIRATNPSCGLGGAGGGDAAAAGGAGGGGIIAASTGGGGGGGGAFTCPRETVTRRTPTPRTRRVTCRLRAGGGFGEAAAEVG